MEKWTRLSTIVQPILFPRVSLFTRGSLHQRFRPLSSKTAQSSGNIQDIYLKFLKSYKPAPEKPGAEVGLVKELRLPSAASPPNVHEDLSEELAAYDAEDVHLETEKILVDSSFEELVLKDEEEAPSPGH
ncbi:cipB protein [Gigaspora margarita]|uniref:CipB protein n=1 Tax=Gigaspora margarita TaxID=4874 RepID=A0A8H3X336_GIGMA|nr:cipB protein [Gigaspora margarita]